MQMAASWRLSYLMLSRETESVFRPRKISFLTANCKQMPSRSPKACVIGSGPNGLAAAIMLAQAGVHTEVLEAEAIPGGAVRTLELTLPGFKHDFGSAVHPLGAGSPFFSSLPLHEHGLDWVHSPAVLAHPLDDGTAVMLERNLSATETSLGVDGNSWVKLMRPFVDRWQDFAPEV